jgi:hypothetical protein
MSRALGGPMKKEGYQPGLHRRDHRLRLDHRSLGAAEHHRGGLWRVGNVSIAGLFMAGVVPD